MKRSCTLLKYLYDKWVSSFVVAVILSLLLFGLVEFWATRLRIQLEAKPIARCVAIYKRSCSCLESSRPFRRRALVVHVMENAVTSRMSWLEFLGR